MKKVCALFLSIFVSPVFASGIASNSATAPCTNTTLETYSGNTNLAADWQPNTINLRWYNNNTLLDVQSAANTCVYDGTLTVPSTAPNRTGYTFAGWEVRPQMDFGTIPTTYSGTPHWAKGWYENAEYCLYDTNKGYLQHVDCNSDATYNELQPYEWKVHFYHGDLYGMAGCSKKGDSNGLPGTPTIGEGKYCWCKATGYKASNTDVIVSPLFPLPWIADNNRDNDVYCNQICAGTCAHYVAYVKSFQAALFTPAGN